MSLANCIKKAGKAINKADADKILSKREELIAKGMDEGEADFMAIKSVRDEIGLEVDDVINQTGKGKEPLKDFSNIQNFRKPEFALDSEELIEVGADIKDGIVTLYHRTTEEAASKIRKTGVFNTKEDGVFFSTSKTGQGEGYGAGVVEVKVPLRMLELDDIFDGEAHVRVPLKKSGSINLKGMVSDIKSEKALPEGVPVEMDGKMYDSNEFMADVDKELKGIDDILGCLYK